VGHLECYMSVRETAVLPQQLLKQLLSRFQHTLQGLNACMMYAGLLSSFTLSIAYLTRNSGTMYADFLEQFHAKYCVLNPKLGNYEDICVSV
jgi:hypothetical protein